MGLTPTKSEQLKNKTMNDQSETTNPPQTPRLCTSGCGFFGSNANGDLCSKCWNDKQAREGKIKKAAAPVATSPPVINQTSQSQQQEVKTDSVSNAPTTKVSFITEDNDAAKKPPAVTTTTTAVKKKKKKSSYKNMMAGIVQNNIPERSIDKEKDGIRKVTGGGAFSKIDKI